MQQENEFENSFETHRILEPYIFELYIVIQIKNFTIDDFFNFIKWPRCVRFFINNK
jgi:hypothetical protein